MQLRIGAPFLIGCRQGGTACPNPGFDADPGRSARFNRVRETRALPCCQSSLGNQCRASRNSIDMHRPTALAVFRHGFGPIGRAEFPDDSLDVILYRIWADIEDFRDFSVRSADRNPHQDLVLARAQDAAACGRRRIRGGIVIRQAGHPSECNVNLGNERVDEATITVYGAAHHDGASSRGKVKGIASGARIMNPMHDDRARY